MINFYPGPSKIHEQYPEIMSNLIKSGVVSYNHRSKEFSHGYRLSVETLKEKLELPEGYEVVFLSSATECWEVLSQSFSDKKTLFLYNGAFGEKWSQQGDNLIKDSSSIKFAVDQEITDYSSEAEYQLICYVQNETSNGTRVSKLAQKKIKQDNPSALIAIDATSSLGGENLPYHDIDICFSSVQKCLGMPAGLAVMILSPRAIAEIGKTTKSGYYNDLQNIYSNHTLAQTTHTPNILGILGIGELYNTIPKISSLEKTILKRKNILQTIINESGCFKFIVEKDSLRSNTVFCLKHNAPHKIIADALSAHRIILGKGYGEWKNKSIRIANFPAHTDQEFEILCNFIRQCK